MVDRATPSTGAPVARSLPAGGIGDEADREMTDLYRHYDDQGKLLYVGVSKSTLIRLGRHEANAHWYERISQIKIEKHPSREAALEAERKAIQTENPLCNIQRRPVPIGATDNKKMDRNAIAAQSATALTQSLVWFNTTYSASDIAIHLSINETAANRLIESGEVSSIELECRGRIVRRVTGWQLIEFLESRERAAAKKNNRGVRPNVAERLLPNTKKED
jgi:hypothetical protein